MTSGPTGVAPVTGHGSDRRFWRIRAGDWSAVAMLSGPDDGEFARGADIAGFLHARGLGGAEVLARDDYVEAVEESHHRPLGSGGEVESRQRRRGVSPDGRKGHVAV
mgnify:CR=1 FL=1